MHRGTVSARVQATLKSSSGRKCTRIRRSFFNESRDEAIVRRAPTRTLPKIFECEYGVSKNIIQKPFQQWDGVTVPGCFIRYVNRCKIVLRCSPASCRCGSCTTEIEQFQLIFIIFFFFFNGSICLLYCMNYNICVFVETPLFDRFFFFCKYFYGILKILIREKRFDENFQNILSSVRTINYKLKFL